MISADEARAKTEYNLAAKAKEDLVIIYEKIDEEACKGSYELYFKGIINKDAVAALRQKGYKVKYYSGEFDDYYRYYDGYFKIDWRRKKNWKTIVKNMLPHI